MGENENDGALYEERRRLYPILEYFRYEHLPPALQEISQPFSELAYEMALGDAGRTAPECAAGLRKLLEAKDCMVRAALRRD